MERADADCEGGVIRLFLCAPVPPLALVSDNEQDSKAVEDAIEFYHVGIEVRAADDSWWFGVNDDDGRDVFAGAEGNGKESFRAAFSKMIDSLSIKATPLKPAGLSDRKWFEAGPARYEQKYADMRGVGREIGDAILFFPDGANYHNMPGHPEAYVLNKKHMHPCRLFYYKDGSASYCGSQYYKKEPWLFDSLSEKQRSAKPLKEGANEDESEGLESLSYEVEREARWIFDHAKDLVGKSREYIIGSVMAERGFPFQPRAQLADYEAHDLESNSYRDLKRGWLDFGGSEGKVRCWERYVKESGLDQSDPSDAERYANGYPEYREED